MAPDGGACPLTMHRYVRLCGRQAAPLQRIPHPVVKHGSDNGAPISTSCARSSPGAYGHLSGRDKSAPVPCRVMSMHGYDSQRHQGMRSRAGQAWTRHGASLYHSVPVFAGGSRPHAAPSPHYSYSACHDWGPVCSTAAGPEDGSMLHAQGIYRHHMSDFSPASSCASFESGSTVHGERPAHDKPSCPFERSWDTGPWSQRRCQRPRRKVYSDQLIHSSYADQTPFYGVEEGAYMRSCFGRHSRLGSFSGAGEGGRDGAVQADKAWSSGLPSGGVERGFETSSAMREGADWSLDPRAHDTSTKGALQIGADTDESVFAYLMT